MTPRAAVLLPLLVLGGCSCSDELAVGSLGDDAGPDAEPGPDATVAPPAERPCGLPERWISFALPGGDSEASISPLVLHGYRDDLLVARYDTNVGLLQLYRMDLTTEAVTPVGSVETSLPPAQIRVHDGYEILLSEPDGSRPARWGLVRFAPDGALDLHAEDDLVDIGHFDNPIPTARGFVAKAADADGPLLVEITRDGVRKGPHADPLQVDGDETRDLTVVRVRESPGRAEVAVVDTTEPLPAELSWSTAYAASGDVRFHSLAALATGEGVVLALFVSEGGSSQLRVSWMDGDHSIAQWTGWEGVDGRVWLAGNGERVSIFGALWPEDTTEPIAGTALAHALISGPGEIGTVRVLREHATSYAAPWVAGGGGHAVAMVAGAGTTVEVFVSCEGAEP